MNAHSPSEAYMEEPGPGVAGGAGPDLTWACRVCRGLNGGVGFELPSSCQDFRALPGIQAFRALWPASSRWVGLPWGWGFGQKPLCPHSFLGVLGVCVMEIHPWLVRQRQGH